MPTYHPPVSDMLFWLYDVHGFSHDDLDRETGEAVLDEAAKLASDVLAPLNDTGDREGSKLENGAVTTAKGFKAAYTQYCEGGWNAVPFDPAYGGQGLPWALAFPIQEMWQGANLSFGLCPLLNQGAVEAILSHGSETQKQTYLPKLIEGEWAGTMNITEPQAGSDLGLIRTKAERQSDDTYRIFGQKIFITFGEHDLTDNIIHLVLARTPDAPDDVKGLSLFIVPKFLEDGTRNDLQCTGLEHKMGIHASPTCTMQFGEVEGDKQGAVGYLIGDLNSGLKYMFTMMNNARLSVGLQGVALAERAYQAARDYAAERMQGKPLSGGDRIAIAQHADVQRMLMSMRTQVEAGRALTYEAALALDKAAAGDQEAQARVDLLTPIVKSWCTDMACEVASTAVQVHGGMGFVEEGGVAQYYRDARILPIYEGTNGIQAADLVFRKILRDGGVAAKAYIAEMKARSGGELAPYLDQLSEATDHFLSLGKAGKLDEIAFASVPYQKAFGTIAGAALLIQAAGKDEGRKESQDFYLSNILPLAEAYFKMGS